MNLVILGATGRVGSHIAALAARDGHHVTLLVRQPENLQLAGDNVTVIQGNALAAQALELAVHGAHAVISALSTDGASTLSEGMPLLIRAMSQSGVRRIITIGTAGILQSRVSPDLLRYQSSESRRTLTRAAEEHHKAYEALRLSELDWTIVCPTYLPDGAFTGTYRVAKDLLPEDGKQISVQDTAAFAYAQLDDPAYIRSRVGIAY
ncbi:NAD(P)-dependent oxidoreductase [Paenibacillus rigui]|uniref:NAD(P)-binding domain-containing protein n=1 Tax=Paenibacillus rigui TaxID=554312 RepID=A0A229UQL9_9BACL|nr:NAD(P)H-binding protein [Paenibacillus rigui]OXM85722.1 hypothetical protein CF651_14010 [Paenibacillus rigui]